MELLANIINYNIRFLGDDYKDKDWDGKKQEELRGIKPYFINRDHNLSSTNLKNRIRDCK